MILEEIKNSIISRTGDRFCLDDFEYPPQPEQGDLSLPMFRAAKELKRNPSELAREFLSKMSGEPITGVATFKTAGPYLNFIFDKAYIFNRLTETLARGDLGRNADGGGKRVLIEFANQNTHKEFHIGHLRNLCFGDAIGRIMSANGYESIPVSYINDFGIHVAKTLWAYLSYYQKSELPENKGRFLGQIYVRASAEIKEDPHKADLAKFMMKKIESRSGEEYELWQKTRLWSIEQFEYIYQELGVEFKHIFYESEYIDQGREMVQELKKQGVLKESQGALIADLEEQGLGVLVVLRSDGTATYPVADIPLAAAKREMFKPDISLYVVDLRQELYFKQLFRILEKMGHQDIKKHLKHDFVKLPSGMISSRSGNVVTYEELNEELVLSLRSETVKRHPDWPEADIDMSARALAAATVKYELLKVGAEQAITFDIKEALSFQGNTAAYILYTYARIQSIVRKAGDRAGKPSGPAAWEEIEGRLLIKLAKYPEAVREAGTRFDPSVLCRYAFELAQLANDHYQKVPVLKAEPELMKQRLALLEHCNAVLKSGLEILGIRPIERM